MGSAPPDQFHKHTVHLPTQVPDRLLPPNLHIAVCRFAREEMQQGLIADDTEMWAERGMSRPKQLARRALHAETWIKATQSIKRALLQSRAWLLNTC
jgi:hypothetical protein